MTEESKEEQNLEKEFTEMFGEDFPDPAVFPKQFDYLVRLFKYEKMLQKNSEESELKSPDVI